MYECPKYVIALIRDLDSYIGVCYWNKEQKQWQSPLQNTGNSYKNDTFELNAYDWSEEMNENNFKANMSNGKPVTLTWYKHIGRCCTVSCDVYPEEWVRIYDRCMDSVRKDFGKYAPNSSD